MAVRLDSYCLGCQRRAGVDEGLRCLAGLFADEERVPSELREAIRGVLLAMADDPGCRERLSLGMVEGFVRVDASSYDDYA